MKKQLVQRNGNILIARIDPFFDDTTKQDMMQSFIAKCRQLVCIRHSFMFMFYSSESIIIQNDDIHKLF